jgi:hypothetical protein
LVGVTVSSWDDYRLFCIHGIREDLDYHSCSECQDIARKAGKKVILRQETFMVTEDNKDWWEKELAKHGWVFDTRNELIRKKDLFRRTFS